MQTTLKIIGLLSVALILPGCVSKQVVFATKTNIGLDVSGTAQVPDKVSFTYGRFEGAIVPRSTSGDAYSVLGGLDADVNFFGRQTIQQTFATGAAAEIAADDGQTNATNAAASDCRQTNSVSTKPLFFVTDTAYGLKLSAGKQDISPTLMMGFKRVEGAIIPVDASEKEVRSVYADLVINSRTSDATSNTITFPNNGGVRIVQGFATGRAAELRASNKDVKQALSRASSPTAAQIGAQVTNNISALDKVAAWVAAGTNAADQKTRFKQALNGVLADADAEKAFSAFKTPDEATIRDYFRSNIAPSNRAVNQVKDNTKSAVNF